MKWIKRLAGIVSTLTRVSSHSGTTTADVGYNTDHSNLMVVLRESVGANKTDSALSPILSVKTTLEDGKQIEIGPAWFNFIGDMHIRFVYDGPNSMRGLSREEFEKLGLKPEQAVALAIRNIKRVYGPPGYAPWSGGLMVVEGQSSDINSSYFLDEAFWQTLLAKNPEGLVVAVPKRGGLLFTPLSDRKAVEGLRKGVNSLFTTSESLRVSSALYLFKDGQWSVFQAANSQE